MQMLLGYEYTNGNEDSLGRNYGHQNVIYRHARMPLYSTITHPAPQDLWNSLPQGDSLTIPHHSGDSDHPYTLDHFDGRFVRLIEVYQERGSFECWCCKEVSGDGDSCDSGGNFNLSPADGGGYFQAALAKGQRVGAIASPDHHGFKGLAGVYAPSGSREDIFEALHARRTFGVTSYASRLSMDLRADGHMMGQEYSLSGTCPVFYVRASTDYVDSVTGKSATIGELKLYRVTDSVPGEEGHIFQLNPQTGDATAVFYDADCPQTGSAAYYLRAEQNWDAAGLPSPIGWTSPVFVTWESGNVSRDAIPESHASPTVVAPGQTFEATMTMKNGGTIAWTGLENYALRLLDDAAETFKIDAVQSLESDEYALVGASFTRSLVLTAPSKPGQYTLRWQMTSPAGEFGAIGSATIEVETGG
jgi:hypothetical protein